jgi:hypothetical protein
MIKELIFGGDEWIFTIDPCSVKTVLCQPELHHHMSFQSTILRSGISYYHSLSNNISLTHFSILSSHSFQKEKELQATPKDKKNKSFGQRVGSYPYI